MAPANQLLRLVVGVKMLHTPVYPMEVVQTSFGLASLKNVRKGFSINRQNMFLDKDF